MGGHRYSNSVLLAKIETTYNTDSVPTAGSNAILIRNGKLSSEGLRMNDRPAVRGSTGKLQRIYGGTLKRFTFECEVKGSGAAGTAPEIGPILRSCGMDETIAASTSVTYSTISASHESACLYWFEGGRKRHILTGCRGTVTIVAEAGGLMLAQFELVGHYVDTTDQSQPSPTYNSQVPRAVVNMAVAINGVTAIIAKSWQWALGWTIATPPSIAASDGYGDIVLTERDVTGSIVIESELDSVLDVDALLAAGSKFAFASGVLGSVAGNRVQVTTPASSTYCTDTGHEEADGICNRSIPLAVDDNTPNEEISLIFT